MDFEYDGETLTIRRHTYMGGYATCLRIVDKDGCPYATLTVNIEGIELEEGELLIKTWSENADIAKACKHLFIDTGKLVTTGYCMAEIWRIA